MASRKRPPRQTRSAPRPGKTPAGRPVPIVPVLAAILVALGAWVYASSFKGVLVLDDIRAIARNETIRTLWPLSVPLSPPPASTVSGRPIANLSFALNYAAAPRDVRDVFAPRSGGAPGGPDEAFLRNVRGYHLLNVVIHLAAGLVLFGMVRRTLLTGRLAGTFARSAPWIAASTVSVSDRPCRVW